MVQILRDQMRNVTPDMSDANRLAEGARVFSDWGTMFKKAGSLANQFNAEQKKEQLEIEKADQNMIDTQIGSTLSNQLMRANAEKIASGVDPNTNEYNQWLDSERERIFQPYIDQMQSDKGRATMQKMARDTTDKLVASNIGKIAKNRKSAQAQAAFAATGKQYKNDAFEFGKLGDWDSFQEATKPQREAMIKYAKKKGGDAAAAETEYQLDYNGIINYLGGLAESDPDLVVNMLDKEGTAHEQLKGLIPDKMLERFSDSYVKNLKEQKYQMQERLKTLPVGSSAHNALKKEIAALEDKINNPDEDAYGQIREALASVVLPEAKKNAEKAALARKQMEEKYEVDTFAATISPDAQERFNAKSNISNWFGRAKSYVKDLMGDKEAKTPMEKMKKAYYDMKDATKDVLKADPEMQESQKVLYETSKASAEALNMALMEDDMPDIVRLTHGFEAIAEARRTPGMTEERMEKLQNIIHAGFYDKIFGETVRGVLQSPDRMFPDTSLLTNIVNPMSYSSDMQLTMMGMPSKDIADTDIDTVQAYLQANAIRIIDTAIDMIDKAAQLPTTEARQAAMQEVENYVASEKDKVYNTAMKNYGIDLARLREEKKRTGRAFTQIGYRVKEYLGDTPDGVPIFESNMSHDMMNAIQKRTEASAKQAEKKGEK